MIAFYLHSGNMPAIKFSLLVVCFFFYFIEREGQGRTNSKKKKISKLFEPFR